MGTGLMAVIDGFLARDPGLRHPSRDRIKQRRGSRCPTQSFSGCEPDQAKWLDAQGFPACVVGSLTLGKSQKTSRSLVIRKVACTHSKSDCHGLHPKKEETLKQNPIAAWQE